ncbi:MAG: translocation/assembly module TamB domain-containing protein [Bacteroidales bacterium]|nr:translocation/assembly module TamB domain-containing protein [Bacteroidales bacterium]
MSRRKLSRFLLIFLVVTLGLVIVLFTAINLPFSRRFATSRVNQILSQAELPLRIQAIKKILPASVQVQGALIAGPRGDTILYAGELEADIRLLALLRSRVVIRDLQLDGVRVEIARDSTLQELNIASVFQTGKKEEPEVPEKNPAHWKIFIRKGRLSNISFRMNDSLNGIRVSQHISDLGMRGFRLLLAEKELFFRSLEVSGSRGNLLLNSSLQTSNENSGFPWNMGFQSLALKNIDFTFMQLADSLKLQAQLKEANMQAEKIDLPSKTLDLKRFEIKDATCSLQSQSSGPGDLFSGIDLDMRDVRFGAEQLGMKVRKLNFETERGFILKKMQGELDSGSEQTALQVELETGNSQIALEGFAGASLPVLLKGPEQLENASLDIRSGRISLKDLSFILRHPVESPVYAFLSPETFELGTALNYRDSTLNISGFSVSRADGFNLDLKGNFDQPFSFPESRTELDLEITGIDPSWAGNLLQELGIEDSIPDVRDLLVTGHVSGSIETPDIRLNLLSSSGSVGIAGSVDIPRRRFQLACSLDQLALGEFLLIPELGTLSASGEVKGAGLPQGGLNADFFVQINSLEFKAYTYRELLLVGRMEPGEYELNLVARDPSLKGDLSLELNLSDSVLMAAGSGSLMAQLDHLNLYEDTLAIELALEGQLSRQESSLESEITASEIRISTPGETALADELRVSFKSDTLASWIQARADFFHLDMILRAPLNQLDSAGKDYRDYFASFREPAHIFSADRLSGLPEIDLTGQISSHGVLDLFLADTGIHFTTFDLSIDHRPGENILSASVRGDEISYGKARTAHLDASITDSAGTVFYEAVAERSSMNSGPENRVKVSGNLSKGSTVTTISAVDSLEKSVYRLEIAGKADSKRIVLEIPSRELILNRHRWQMQSPDLLTMDISTGTVSPSFRLENDSSLIQIRTLDQNQTISYNLDLKQVELSSLLRRGLFPGRPDATFTGTLNYDTGEDQEKRVSTGLQISDVRYSGQDFSDIRLDGTFNAGPSESYTIDLRAQMDSSGFILEGEKIGKGERSMDASFSHFPLIALQPFTREYLSDLGGFVSGKFAISTVQGSEQSRGELNFEDARVKVKLLNSSFRIPSQGIRLTNERVMFAGFTVLDTLGNALKVDGYVDFGGKGPVTADLNISSSKLQLMSRDENTAAPVTGNVFVDSRLTVKGPLTKPVIEGKILLTEGSEIFYQQKEDLRISESEKIVNFVSHADGNDESRIPLAVRQQQFINSSIETLIEIDPSTRINFTLDRRMFHIDLDVKGGGQVLYNMLENERVTLSGSYEINEGSARLNMIGWPRKSFAIAKGGYIRWDGVVENPELRFEAENRVRSALVNPVDGKRRDIEFLVILQMSGYLSDLELLFTIRTPDQYVMSILNTMSPEEKMRQAIQVLLFETIDLPGISQSTDYMTQQVNQILASQLNQLTKNTIKGVDISFGLDSYDQASAEGGSESSTSLSYEVSKSLLNNRGQIEVSGRLHDLNQQPGASDHAVNNVSFEYSLDSAATMYLKVYNEHSYDDVFEGEVTKTGLGFTYRKSYRSFRDIWRRKK